MVFSGPSSCQRTLCALDQVAEERDEDWDHQVQDEPEKRPGFYVSTVERDPPDLYQQEKERERPYPGWRMAHDLVFASECIGAAFDSKAVTPSATMMDTRIDR